MDNEIRTFKPIRFNLYRLWNKNTGKYEWLGWKLTTPLFQIGNQFKYFKKRDLANPYRFD
jgi:hypothetical protein